MGKSDIIVLLVIVSIFVAGYLIVGYFFNRLRSSIISKMNKLPNNELPNKETANNELVKNDEDNDFQKYEGADLEKYQKEMEKEYKRIEKEQKEKFKI